MTAWRQVSLGELCDVTAGGTPSRAVASHFGGHIPWVKIGDMVQGQVLATEESLSRSGLESSAAKLLPAGTVLLSIFATIGRTAVLGIDAATNQAIAGLTPRDTNVLLPQYLRRFLDSQAPALERRARGVAQANINLAILKSLPVPLPPLAEQRRLAKMLDKADALRAMRRAALDYLDTLTQAIFFDMFGDPTTNPKGWPERVFDDTMRDETSRSQRLPQSQFLPTGRYPVVDQGQADVAGYCDDESYLCNSDLPAVVFGDHTRAIKLVRVPFVIGADGAKVLAPQEDVDATFLSWLLRLLKIPELGYSRHMRVLRRLRFPVPPLEFQHVFCQRQRAMDVRQVQLEQASRLTDTLFAVLQHRAFRAEL